MYAVKVFDHDSYCQIQKVPPLLSKTAGPRAEYSCVQKKQICKWIGWTMLHAVVVGVAVAAAAQSADLYSALEAVTFLNHGRVSRADVFARLEQCNGGLLLEFWMGRA
jgi:hypothetical protein